jgi:hypothetical protein
MASVIDIIVWVFAAMGLVALSAVALYYIAKQVKKYKPPEKPIWPDASYMEKLGAQCPTGWIYRGENRNGENICQNYHNIPVGDNNCYATGMEQHKISYFDKIIDWNKCQDDPGKCDNLKNRCSWIQKCGPPSETRDPTQCNSNNSFSNSDVVSRPYASWIGVADKC